jgi:hypothetical protein
MSIRLTERMEKGDKILTEVKEGKKTVEDLNYHTMLLGFEFLTYSTSYADPKPELSHRVVSQMIESAKMSENTTYSERISKRAYDSFLLYIPIHNKAA